MFEHYIAYPLMSCSVLVSPISALSSSMEKYEFILGPRGLVSKEALQSSCIMLGKFLVKTSG